MQNRSIINSIIISSLLIMPLSAQKFYPDDPLEKDPTPMHTVDAERRGFSSVLEYFTATFTNPGERHPEIGVIPAGGVNTLGNVPDNLWFTNRHAKKRMTLEELRTGQDRPAPAMDAPWDVLTVKAHGERTGMLIRDSKNDFYLLRFDPRSHIELATGAEMVTSNLLHAIGYFVPDNHIVYFERDQLLESEEGEDISSAGVTRDLEPGDIDRFLREVAKDPHKGYRAVATALGPLKGYKIIGPFQVFGQRSDDPNDIVPHEHRRDLRGLHVVLSWVNHSRFQTINTLDVLGEDNGVQAIRHYLVDFVATLGSGGDRPKPAREGNEPLYDLKRAGKNLVSFGVYTPAWQRAKYPGIRSVGHFESKIFDPELWITDQDIAAFSNRLPDDEYWAAKLVMAFSDEDIRAIVESGEYSDPRAVDWLVTSLAERRDKIGRAYFTKVLPLDNFEVQGNTLAFEDLAVKHSFVTPRSYTLQWFRFDNEKEESSDIGTSVSSFEILPVIQSADPENYFGARIWADDPETSVIVYLRKEDSGLKVVGIDRTWPDKVIADPSLEEDTGINRYADLASAQQKAFESHVQDYNAQTGKNLTAEEYFDSMSISERTTYDAITHALMNSKLTDAEGKSLGTALDLVKGIERVAGQYYGAGGDQQFRLYCHLQPGTRETLEKSKEFHMGHLNTVYHVGYPYSFRQEGKPPTIQFSLSEDGSKADIDVDYRSSKAPAALWNGHLTSSNSDVRSGENYDLHNGRWRGFVAWWRGLFGDLKDDEQGQRDLLSMGPPVVPTDLPPNRPLGASIEYVEEATQEFLTDWLVRKNFPEALDFLSDQSLACMNLDDDAQEETITATQARLLLREIMEGVADQMGDTDNLTEAIEQVEAEKNKDRMIAHPFSREFSVFGMETADAETYLCSSPETTAPTSALAPVPQARYGIYFASLFRFKFGDREGGVLGLLWRRVEGQWQIVTYKIFTP
jgi:hypothetical protein